MSQSPVDFPLATAQAIMRQWLAYLRPFCTRVHPVGSVRRLKPLVHDLEIMVLPRLRVERDMFDQEAGTVSELAEVFGMIIDFSGARLLKGGEKTKTLQLREGIKLEIFIFTPERWAVELVIHTGPAGFSQRCVTPRSAGGYLPFGMSIRDGWQVFDGGQRVALDEERDFLKLLGFDFIKPWERDEFLERTKLARLAESS